jgi:hypothetical protein
VKVLMMHPQYADALLAGGAAVCCVTLGACARLERPRRPVADTAGISGEAGT